MTPVLVVTMKTLFAALILMAEDVLKKKKTDSTDTLYVLSTVRVVWYCTMLVLATPPRRRPQCVCRLRLSPLSPQAAWHCTRST